MKQYTLKEIALWQTEVINNESKKTLFALQKGLVWEPHQIEKIWDSIFRGYPVGAITLSLNEENGQRILLDGHQRCISIALGHYNPFDKGKQNSISSLKDYNISVWIELNPSQMNDKRHYVFRCSNQNIPLDANFPIPLAFILKLVENDSLSFKDFKLKLFSKLENLKIHNKLSDITNLNYNEIDDEKWMKIYNGIINYQHLLIPEIVVNSKLFNENNMDGIENLFL